MKKNLRDQVLFSLLFSLSHWDFGSGSVCKAKSLEGLKVGFSMWKSIMHWDGRQEGPIGFEDGGGVCKSLLICPGMLCPSLFEAGGGQRSGPMAHAATVFHRFGRVRVSWRWVSE